MGFGLLGLGLYLLQRLTRKALNVKANDLVLHYKKPPLVDSHHHGYGSLHENDGDASFFYVPLHDLLGLGLGLYLLQRLTRKTLNVKANDLVLHYKKPAFRVFSNLNRARFHQGEYNLNKNHIIITKKHIAYVHFIFRCLTTIKHFVHMHLYSRALTTLFPTTFIYI